ncbi:MAG: hypothetical protein E7452_05225 [Ruminococcaceae bacterium]|nr:hypothetical protein [Oscillospiraceae bacterium]
MKKRLTALFLSLCMLFSVSAAALAADLTTELAIEAVWTDAGDFHEGLARVFDGEKWGYIDADGELAIEAKWDIAHDFSEGLAAVATVVSGTATQTPDVQTWYLIDKTGEIRHELGENNAYYFDSQPFVSGISNGTYVIAPGNSSSYRLGSVRGDANLPLTAFSSGTAYKDGYAIVSASAEGSFTRPAELERLVGILGAEAIPDMLVDFSGKVLWQNHWGMILAVDNGLVTYHSRLTGLWGVDTVGGQEVIPATIENLWYSGRNGTYAVFTDGYATVLIDGVYHLADTKGNLTKLTATQAGRFSEGLVSYSTGNAWGYLNAKGEVAIEAAYLSAGAFSEGVAVVATDLDSFYYIDRSGKRCGETAYEAAYAVSEGLGRVVVDGLYGYVELTGVPTDALGDTPSTWADASVDEAYGTGLVPNELCWNYRNAATRADVVQLAITMLSTLEGCSIEELVEKKTGETLDAAIAAYPFSDSSDRYMIAATALGIINGFTDGTCQPTTTISRAEAAKILAITASLAGIEAEGTPIDFADSGDIRVWAKEYVDFVSATGIMGGIGNNKFDPLSPYTVEQAIVTMLRIYSQAK